MTSSSGLRGRRRTYLTILKRAWLPILKWLGKFSCDLWGRSYRVRKRGIWEYGYFNLTREKERAGGRVGSWKSQFANIGERRVLYLRPGRLRWCVAVGSLVDAGSNLTGAWIVWMELLLKLVILCQYNSQIHRVPAAGRIVTNKTKKILGANVCHGRRR
jgi:hypothetical protein